MVFVGKKLSKSPLDWQAMYRLEYSGNGVVVTHSTNNRKFAGSMPLQCTLNVVLSAHLEPSTDREPVHLSGLSKLEQCLAYL